jgi:hypothetical protein
MNVAGRLLLEGRSPYDLEAMRALGESEGLDFVLGSGYSYPLPFAFLMIPFTRLPFAVAVLLFNAMSILAFGWLVSWWLSRFHDGASKQRLLGTAVLAGAFPPIYGTVANGQANLLVLVPLAVGLAWIVRDGSSGRAGGALLGIATVVKIVPGAAAVALLLARRWPPLISLVVVVALALAAAGFLAPGASAETVGLGRLLGPDPYFTNQSLNGFISRLVLESSRTLPVAPNVFDPAVASALVTLAFGLVTLRVLMRSLRGSPSPATLGLALALGLVAATIAAPKNSFWNQALALPGLGLLLAADAPDLRLSRLRRPDKLLLVVCMAGLWAQLYIWIQPLPKAGSLAPVTTLAQSAALFGMLALWVLIIRRLDDSDSRTQASRGGDVVAGRGIRLDAGRSPVIGEPPRPGR